MMTKVALFSILFCLLSFMPSNALITQLYILCNDQEDYIYLLGNTPENQWEDNDQLMMMSYTLLRREKVSTETHDQAAQLDILMQDAGELYKKISTSAVSPHLMAAGFEIPVKYTTRHTIAKRTLYGEVAVTIFSSKYQRLRTRSEEDFGNEGRERISEQLTFKDVIDEFYAFREDIKAKQAVAKFCDSELFEALIGIADCYCSKLLGLLERNNMDHSAIMTDAAKQLFESAELPKNKKRKLRKVQKKLRNIISPLFELDLLKKLTELASKKRMVIAGVDHILCLKNLLEGNGFYVRNAYGANNYSTALKQEELDTIVILPTAIEHNGKEPTVYLINDTQIYLRITEDGERIEKPLASGKMYSIDPRKVSNVTVRYTGAFELTAKAIAIDEIAAHAQTNDLIIHIIPATTFGVTIGKIEPMLYPNLRRKR